MKKKIGIFLGDVTSSILDIVIHRIISRANELNYDTVFLCSFGSYSEDILYCDGERAMISLPDYSIFDGLIIAEDLLDINGMRDELFGAVKNSAKCPVVYFRTVREGCYSVLTYNEKAMEKMTRHFVEEHGFKDIVYMSGMPGHTDTTERLQGFLKVMEEYNLPVNEHTIFHGDYWREKGKEAVDWFMDGRDTYPQAVICANDYMALSVCDELRKRGVRIPEDVCVSGFDYAQEAQHHKPSITSIEVDVGAMAERSVDIIDAVNRGEKVEKINYEDAILHIHNSCCGKQSEIGDLSEIIHDKYLLEEKTKRMMLSVMEYQDSFEEEDYLYIAGKYHNIVNTDEMIICLCDTQEDNFQDVENIAKFSNSMILKRIFKNEENVTVCNEVFLRKKLLPEKMWPEDKFNNYMFFGLHFKNKIYGYIAIQPPQKGWIDIYAQAYYVNLANAIENASVNKSLADLEEYKVICFNDALTGLYNRRGFDKLLREKFERFKNRKKNCALVSIDMDNLKYINDNYGHSLGDKALTGLAGALSEALFEGEFCSRTGGDEFAACLDMSIEDRIGQFMNAFNAGLLKYDIDEPGCSLGASVGVCEFKEVRRATLMNIIKVADERMYENKRYRKDMMLKGKIV